MAEEIKTTEENQDTVLSAEEQLAEVMKNMVPRSELEKAKGDYARLYGKVLNGEFGNQPAPETPEISVDDKAMEAIKSYAKGSGHSVCKLFEDMLAVDDYELSKARRSGFEATDGERDLNGARDSAERCRQLYEYALEQANGDDNLFIAQLQSHLRDR